jgi:hypothetical protein
MKAQYYISMFTTMMLSHLSASACSVPVFRYALERWAPDSYQIEIIHQKGISPPTEVIEPLQKTHINATLNTAAAQISAGIPTEIRLFSPQQRNTKPVCIYRAPLSSNSVSAIISSPIRHEIAQQILDGESVVWLLLKSGNSAEDKKAEDILRNELRHMQKELKLPEISEADTQIAETPGRPKLRISFSLLTLARTNRQETVLVNALLLQSDPDKAKKPQPMAFPICGAGRAFPPLAGSELNTNNIGMVCEFLTGECSCEIKNMNPGFDLPINTDWQLGDSEPVYTETTLPPLTGVLPDNTNTTTAANNSYTNITETINDTDHATTHNTAGPAKPAIITIALLAAAVLLASAILLRRASQS